MATPSGYAQRCATCSTKSMIWCWPISRSRFRPAGSPWLVGWPSSSEISTSFAIRSPLSSTARRTRVRLPGLSAAQAEPWRSADLWAAGMDVALAAHPGAADACSALSLYARAPLVRYGARCQGYRGRSASLLHRNVSDFDAVAYRSRFTGSEFYLADHHVKGAMILPGVVGLEMAARRLRARQRSRGRAASRRCGVDEGDCSWRSARRCRDPADALVGFERELRALYAGEWRRWTGLRSGNRGSG